ncbi:dienelactone hydrolase family protein [bacterium]|jgi:predicted peptidase|nr:dienelactone hydrolase family protein [bacterium]
MRLFVIVVVLGTGLLARAGGDATPSAGEFLDRKISDDGGEHGYVIYTPPAFDTNETYPLVLFLHGSGERGTDNRKQIAVGLAPALKEDPSRCPAIVLFPQAESTSRIPIEVWAPTQPDGQRALAIVEETTKSYKIDPDRVYLTGLSMGGMGAWRMGAADPDRWAAMVPICGGGNSGKADQLIHLPIWCFHGGADRTVPAQFSRQMIQAVQKAGGMPKYTEYEGVGHNSWDRAYREPDLWKWLLAQNRKDRQPSSK